MRRVILIRKHETEKGTVCDFHVYGEGRHLLFLAALELPWKHNRRNISRIPEGTYLLVKEWSEKFNKMLWELKGVPGRSEIKIHNANFTRQLQGCIAVGLYHKDIDQDGQTDVADSLPGLEDFHDVMSEETQAIITIVNAVT